MISRVMPGGQRGTTSMTSERSSVAPHACALRAVTALAILAISSGLGWPRASAAANRPEAKLMSVPLSFEPNQGRLDSTVQFLTRGSGYALFLTPGTVVLNLERQQPQAASVDTLRMSLIGANPKANRSEERRVGKEGRSRG